MSETYRIGDLVKTPDGYFGVVEDVFDVPDSGEGQIKKAGYQEVLCFLGNGLRQQMASHLLTPSFINGSDGAHANFAELINAQLKVTMLRPE